MIKSELIHLIASSNPHLYHRDVERIVNVVFDEIVEALSRGDRVELRGFGAFSVKRREARKGTWVVCQDDWRLKAGVFSLRSSTCPPTP